MSLYPSLEDMKVGQMLHSQSNVPQILPFSAQPSAPNGYPTLSGGDTAGKFETFYPTLDDYMGLSLTSQELALINAQNSAVEATQPFSVTVGNTSMVAPISANSLGLQRANVTHGVREVVLCKDRDGKIGLRVQSINKGVFVVLVHSNSPASMVGLRFGDQILQINGDNVAGYSRDKVHDIIKKATINNINIVVRDRPFERTITLHKDSTGHIGFTFKNGKIDNIVKDSSAARNGLLIDHNLLEVNGQNVVGMEDKFVRQIIESGGNVITLTIMPTVIFEHMMKHMHTSLVKKLMDHSIPDL